MGLSRTSARDTYFDGENGRISVDQYFQEKYNMRLRYPHLPVAKCGGKGALLPLEVLKVTSPTVFNSILIAYSDCSPTTVPEKTR